MSIEIVSFRPLVKNTLQGFCTVRLPKIGLEIRDIAIHQKNGQRWVQLPSKPYEKNGEQKWSYIILWYEKEREKAFQSALLTSLESYLATKNTTTDVKDDDIPF